MIDSALDARRHGRSPDSRPATAAPAARLSIAYSRRSLRASSHGSAARPARALRGTAELLRSLGHEVVERDPEFRALDVPVLLAIMFRGIHDYVERDRAPAAARAPHAQPRPAGALVSDRMVERLLVAERRIAERVGRLLVEHDVLLMPMTSQPAVPDAD